MGMFDYLTHEGRLYQTKDLHCLLDHYRIVSNRLVNNEYDNVFIPNEQRHDKPDVDMNYHGDLYLITDAGEFERYRARFTDGTLVSFQRIQESEPKT